MHSDLQPKFGHKTEPTKSNVFSRHLYELPLIIFSGLLGQRWGLLQSINIIVFCNEKIAENWLSVGVNENEGRAREKERRIFSFLDGAQQYQSFLWLGSFHQ